jgi:O-antigen/teichoic acid export membrane protein
VAIASKGRPSVLGASLASLGRQSRAPDSVWVAVPSAEDAPDDLGYPGVTVLISAPGLTTQRNAILDAIPEDVDVLVFLDDDAEMHPLYLERAAALMDVHPEVALMCGLVVADGARTGEIERTAARARLDVRHPGDGLRRGVTAYGCNMVVRAATARSVRFDEALRLYGWLEDRDFGQRVARHGEVVEFAGCELVHLGVSNGRQSGERLGFQQVVHPVYLWRKGVLTLGIAAYLIARPVFPNLLRSLTRSGGRSDSPGRLRGNLSGVRNVLRTGGDPRGVEQVSARPLRLPATERRLRLSGGIALADQVLSGLSNFLTVALVARSATPVDFGHFAVTYALFITLLGLARQLWGTQIALKASAPEAVRRVRELLGATLYATPAAWLLMALCSLALAGPGAVPVIAVLSVALPVVVAQDLCRFTSVAAGRPGVAAASDLVWVLTVAVGFVIRPPMLVALLIWLVGAVLALAVALLALRLTPALRGGWAQLFRRHPTGEVSAVGGLSVSLATYVTLGLATVHLSAAAAGALRGASTVMAPVNTFFAFGSLALLSVIYRRPPSGQPRLVRRISAGLVAVSLSWGAVLVLLPDGLGQLLLGETWPGARAVLPWTVIEYVGLSVGLGAVLGLQAFEKARILVTIALVGAGLTVAGSVIAAVAGSSAAAFAAALAITAAVNAILTWSAYAISRRAFARSDA